MQLGAESSCLCTLNTPWGRYRYTRLPFGIKTAEDISIKQMQKLLGDLPGIEIVTNDILVYGATVQEHDSGLEAVLKRVREKKPEAKCR